MLFKTTIASIFTFFILVVFNYQNAHTYGGAAPSGRTGAPPNTTSLCAGCHGQGTQSLTDAVNLMFGSGINEYELNETYDISLTISEAGKKRWGFTMVARDSNNDDVGTWVASGPNTQINGGGTHIGHENAPNNVLDSFTFNFSWIAPSESAGDITFYYSVNAANGNFSTSGDACYNTSFSISEAQNTPQLSVKAKVFLEGFYENGMMKTNLVDDNLLDTAQPFSAFPWAYNGGETVANFANNISDWILVELRDAENLDMVVAQKAALLRNDGVILDIDGSEGVLFDNVPTDSYYLVVRHRNHLDVLSSTAVALPNDNAYDFTQSADMAFGGESQISNLNNGKVAMIGGDTDGNGVIVVDDFNVYADELSAINEYLMSDCDGDGNVSIADFNIYLPNISKIGISYIRL
ncbi:MAG: Reeler domain-containing protein [Chitinophagales bacterium]